MATELKGADLQLRLAGYEFEGGYRKKLAQANDHNSDFRCPRDRDILKNRSVRRTGKKQVEMGSTRRKRL